MMKKGKPVNNNWFAFSNKLQGFILQFIGLRKALIYNSIINVDCRFWQKQQNIKECVNGGKK